MKARRGEQWSLRQAAAAAGVGLRTARTAVARGLIPSGNLLPQDVILLRVAGVCLGTPGPSGVAPSISKTLVEQRDKTAMKFAQALASDARIDAHAAVLLTPRGAFVADSKQEVSDAISRLYPDPVVVIPVGGWRLSGLAADTLAREIA